MNVLMLVRPAAMRMAPAGALGGNQMQLAVAHAALAHRVVGQCPHRLGRAAQHRDLEAGIVVEMDVQGRHLQVVVPVLRLVEPPAEVARLVVVDIGQGGDAETVSAAAPASSCWRACTSRRISRSASERLA